MPNMHGEYALYWHTASFHTGFVDKLWNHIIVAHQHQSLSWRFCERVTCTMAIWSCDFVLDCSVREIFNYSCLRHKLFWSLWLMHCQLYGSKWCQILPIVICTSQDTKQKQDLRNLFFNEIFCLECEFDVTWCSLHKLIRRHVGCCPWRSLISSMHLK